MGLEELVKRIVRKNEKKSTLIEFLKWYVEKKGKLEEHLMGLMLGTILESKENKTKCYSCVKTWQGDRVEFEFTPDIDILKVKGKEEINAYELKSGLGKAERPEDWGAQAVKNLKIKKSPEENSESSKMLGIFDKCYLVYLDHMELPSMESLCSTWNTKKLQERTDQLISEMAGSDTSKGKTNDQTSEEYEYMRECENWKKIGRIKLPKTIESLSRKSLEEEAEKNPFLDDDMKENALDSGLDEKNRFWKNAKNFENDFKLFMLDKEVIEPFRKKREEKKKEKRKEYYEKFGIEPKKVEEHDKEDQGVDIVEEKDKENKEEK